MGLLTALLFVFVMGAGRDLLSGRQNKQEGAAGLDVLTSEETRAKTEEVQTILEQNYLNDVDPEQLSDKMFLGIASGLGDDYAAYYTPEDLEEMRAETNGSYVGIGCTLGADSKTGRLTIMEVYTDSPADQAGLMPGDVLLAWEDHLITGTDVTEVARGIRGMKGPFTLQVLRPSLDQELTFTLECRQVNKDTVVSELMEDGVGYIRIREFDEVTVGQFRDAVDALQNAGASSLVIDVRDNPGGLLNAVCDILDYLLPEGLLVYTMDRSGNREDYRSSDTHRVDLPMAVLVNGNSASASELFAGALHDRDRATLIGTTTFGKGIVQQTFMLKDGSAIKFTVQKYYTPGGTCIQGTGITPDIVVEEPEDEAQNGVQEEETTDAPLEKALEVLRTDGK